MKEKVHSAPTPTTPRAAPASLNKALMTALAVLLVASRSVQSWSTATAKKVRLGSAGAGQKAPRPSSDANDRGATAAAAAMATAWAIGTAAAMSALPLPAVASGGAPVDFTGSYSDPFHPNCQRSITQEMNKMAASTAWSSSSPASVLTLRGTDGNPGCPSDGSGTPWILTGTADTGSGSLVVDFSPKGGPANLRGVWEQDAGGGSPGIRWPDGNKWTKID
jgi:hypothetical protein